MSTPRSSNNVGGEPARRRAPKHDREVWISGTVVVADGATYGDSVLTTLVHVGPALGDGSQKEGQRPVFKLGKGAKLQNIIIGSNGADGVHCTSDAKLFNVWWSNVGEDALTVKGAGNIEVIGGGALDAADKVFQLNAPCKILIRDFYADKFQTFVRVNGGQSFRNDITIDGCHLRNGGRVVKTDSKDTRAALINIDLVKVGTVAEGPFKSLKKKDIRVFS